MISFLRRGKTTVGLDVGSGFVKAVVVEHGGAEPEVSKVAYTPLVSDAIVEGEIVDAQLVADTIRTMFAANGIKPRNVVTAVGGRDVIVKKILMDRMDEEAAREAIRWEAEQVVPFDTSNVQLDFQILDPHGDGLQMNVLLVAAKRELVDQKVALLRDAGVEASVVDVDAFAMHNAFEYNYPEALDGSVALVNVGHELSTLNVLQEGAPVLTRDIPFGSRRVIEDLRRMHGLTAEEADDVVQGRSDRQDDFADFMADRSAELAVSVDRAVGFLATGGKGIDRAFVSGGAAKLPGLLEAMAERLRVRAELANPLQRLRVRPEVAALFPMDELAPMLMIPVGLALRTPG